MMTFKQNLRKHQILFVIVALLFSTLSFGQTYYLRGDWVDAWTAPHIFSSGRGDVQQVKKQTTATWSSWDFLIVANGYSDRWDLNGIDWNGVMTSTFDNTQSTGNSYTNSAPTANAYYCVNIANTGYSNQDVALIRIGTTAPQTFSSQTLTTSPSNASVDVTMGGSLSSEEKLYIVYRNTSSSNWKKIEHSSSSGSTYTFSIPRQDQGSTVEYFVISTSSSMSLVDDQSEAYYNLRSIEHLDNNGSAYSYTQPTNTWDGTSWSSTFSSGDNVSFGADYTVSAGSSLEVGSIEVSSGYTLTIDASSSGYGQLKASGTITNNGTIIQKQYVSSTGHHGVSSSMSGGFGTTSGTSSELYSYDASTGAYDMTPSTSSAGTGYFAPVQSSNGFISSAGTFSVTGTPNTNHTYTLGYAANQASGGSGSGWNLIGNPYSASLDWSSIDLTGKSINNAIYVWDPVDEAYDYYVSGVSAPTGTYAGSSIANPVIAPMQAFWIQTTANGQSLATSMSEHSTVSSSPTFYKTSQIDNLIFVLQDLNDVTKGDVMWLKNVPGTTNGFEPTEDAWKLTNQGGNPSIYTEHMGEKIAINAIDLSSTISVPMDIDAENSRAVYQLSLQTSGNASYEVMLEDKLYNTLTDLHQQSYSFQLGNWNSSDSRFVLHINQATQVGIEEADSFEAYAYHDGESLHIVSDEEIFFMASITSVSGQKLMETPITGERTSIEFHHNGVYIISLIGQEKTYTFKTLIH